MTPAPSPAVADRAPAAAGAPAGRLETIRKRADFLRAARARRHAAPGFVVQARDRRDQSPAIRLGVTCSKKVGNAVARNRAKRRLREIARLTLPAHGRPGWDYVLIGRKEVTATRPFDRMRADLEGALGTLHGARP